MNVCKKMAVEAQQKIENMDSNLENINKKVKKIRKRVSLIALVPTLVAPVLLGYTLFRKSEKRPLSEHITSPLPKKTLSGESIKPKSSLINTLISHLGFETGTAIVGSLLTSFLRRK